MRWIVVLSIGLLLLAGCGPRRPNSGTVTGTITYKGQPVNAGALTLYATAAEGGTLLVPVTEDGTFGTTDVPPGEYKVVVEARVGGAVGGTTGAQAAVKPTIPFPKKYKDRLTTDLTLPVHAGEQKVELKLTD